MTDPTQVNPYAPSQVFSERPLEPSDIQQQVRTGKVMLATYAGVMISGGLFGVIAAILFALRGTGIADLVMIVPMGMIAGAFVAGVFALPIIVHCRLRYLHDRSRLTRLDVSANPLVWRRLRFLQRMAVVCAAIWARPRLAGPGNRTRRTRLCWHDPRRQLDSATAQGRNSDPPGIRCHLRRKPRTLADQSQQHLI